MISGHILLIIVQRGIEICKRTHKLIDEYIKKTSTIESPAIYKNIHAIIGRN